MYAISKYKLRIYYKSTLSCVTKRVYDVVQEKQNENRQ